MSEKPNPATLLLAFIGLPSACSASHAPIRYSGEKCPLCEAMKERCACCREVGKYCQNGCRCNSRPSSDPGAKQIGLKCPKVPHTGTGYLHADDDDRPYDVDGVEYCGRCHRGTTNGICMNQPGAGEEGK